MRSEKSNGFTLVELVIVIAIAGVLAAIAMPRFIGLQGDAKKSVMLKIAGTATSTFSMVYAKAAVAGVHTAPSATLNINGTNVQLAYGYPTLLSVTNVLQIDPLTNFVLVPLSGTSAYIAPVGSTPSTCRLVYTQATGINSPAALQQFLSSCA